MRENAYDAASTASTVATKSTIVAFRNFAFERSVFQRMIFDVDGQTLDRGVKARPFWHRPRLQRAVEFKAKVVMQTPCIMFLNYKGKCVPVRIAIAFHASRPSSAPRRARTAQDSRRSGVCAGMFQVSAP